MPEFQAVIGHLSICQHRQMTLWYYASFPGIYIHTWEEMLCAGGGPSFTEAVFFIIAVCRLKIKNEFKKKIFLTYQFMSTLGLKSIDPGS